MRLLLAMWLLGLGACGDLYFGGPAPDVRKETGPLTVPPEAVRNGTARDM